MCKICYKCKISKELNEFHKDKYRPDGFRDVCKLCASKMAIDWKKIDHLQFPYKKIFQDILQRCNNKNNWAYKYYGGKGVKCLITIEELKNIWFRDKAYDMKQPSIDRQDSNKNYEYSNCNFIEMEINRIKDRGKPILQISKQGKIIKEFESATIASKFIHRSKVTINDALKGRSKSCAGYLWRYKNG